MHREVIFPIFREYKYTREIAAAVVKHLGYLGLDAALVTPEEYDVSLRARTERVNSWCRQLGKRNVCLVSIHTNAAGNGKQWMNARGWTCYTSRMYSGGYPFSVPVIPVHFFVGKTDYLLRS